MPNTLLNFAKKVILTEAQAVSQLADRLDQSFIDACTLIQNCTGKVILIGMGKSGHIGNKIAATFASTGTPAFAVHPGEAGHGDLGMIEQNDVAICISYSGESDEIMTLVPVIKRLGVAIIAMTGNKNSAIGKISDVHLDVSVEKEACPHNLAPTSSTTVALAMGDALAVSLLNDKGFSPDDFARSHPSGALGRRLLTFVNNIMKTNDDIPIANADTKLLDALLIMSQKALGMVLITNENTLQGIFTDGDLRRVLETHSNIQDLTIGEVMTSNCKSILADKPAMAAVAIMDKFNLNSLPVVDKNNQVLGAINTHTLMQAKII
ncbi:Arabinose 5-phosphate isomerase [Bathymodiolus thermophilus thioautotrophic gill symbiont]|jgi:arabinose-5-phosphate isomerase|uniref:Arabinose 5-phosphate isomerase n=1 Tax=Bathymodiolus thermophilus thioautotrophic gill symbiont TaxID=2360 RepID=A0A1J5UE26_9GAMM|nr:KpsF/GutQ family sugar-phosphate isomerase [Bathymodiolus thermophilus thioautotrophic gill symbiont]AYQ57531.1 Arabinose 5-phosphate isomerase [Bathymodiolus thermophilus thioautotrophic gill symbiont]OIR24173.1 D-arabinose 5-phosphate isomerase [Bathymodiolus thermophilus thioautotrophic gill symbiont]CAB5494343.1 D-arabinose-5-phosphate isomerase (EC [Bathymodiolus thermophilus thioautotrophic gill symbiont]CAB5499587.1 D-arabinose-5-phosphate isomerase (EC [Bathymodiolus thermophilus thi